ncbi:MAG: winged helix-turn-helix domain-containing protein [Frankia sp.]
MITSSSIAHHATVVVVAPGTAVPPPRPERGLWIDRDLRAATADGQHLELTYLEFELLTYLASHPLRVHTRQSLLREVWGYDLDPAGGGRTVDVHITRLRRKLGAEHRSTIETVHRVGYRYRPI